MSRAARRLVPALMLAAAGLGGCISLFPKQAPAQLYSFDARSAPAPAAPDDAPRAAVVAPPVVVARATAGDRLLAVTGQEAAFISGARWVSPAAVLWDETVRRAFLTRSARVRLLTRSESAGAGAFLRLEVPEFEVRYAAPGVAPSVHVALHAMYSHFNGSFSAEHVFTADAPASEDRLAAIVAAYGAAVERVVADLIAWADAHAAAAVAPPPVAPAVAVTTTVTSASTTTRRP